MAARADPNFPKIVLPLSARNPTLLLEEMAHNLTARAPGKSAMRPENRVWGFSRNDRVLPLENRRQRPELRSKPRPAPTIFTPGIPQWPSRDPIGEDGGVNLYGFVCNIPVAEVDCLGLSFIVHTGLWRSLHPTPPYFNAITASEYSKRIWTPPTEGTPYKEINFAAIHGHVRRTPTGSYFLPSKNAKCPNCCDEIDTFWVYRVTYVPYSLVRNDISYVIDITIKQRKERVRFQNAQRAVGALDATNINLLIGAALGSVSAGEIATDVAEGTLMVAELADAIAYGEFDVTEKIIEKKVTKVHLDQGEDRLISSYIDENLKMECVKCPSDMK